jgi:hypothetical protein
MDYYRTATELVWWSHARRVLGAGHHPSARAYLREQGRVGPRLSVVSERPLVTVSRMFYDPSLLARFKQRSGRTALCADIIGRNTKLLGDAVTRHVAVRVRVLPTTIRQHVVDGSDDIIGCGWGVLAHKVGTIPATGTGWPRPSCEPVGCAA